MNFAKSARNLNIAGFVVIMVLYVCLSLSLYKQNRLKDAYENRIQSLALAAELGQSSQDLTRYARTYVVTGNDEYEKKYWEVLAIRNGEAVRPDGKKIALKTMMKNYGFTPGEFEQLTEAENRSNALVALETEAMNAVKGLYKDETGKFTVKGEPDLEKARALMHDKDYHKYAADVQVPVNQFFKMMNERIAGETATSYLWAETAQFGVGVLIVILSVCLILASRFTSKAIRLEVENLRGSFTKMLSFSEVLSSSSQELSSAATESASSLQETVSSLEEMTATIGKTADNTRDCQNASTNGQTVADDGQKVISDMLEAIDQIGASTKNIMSQVEAGNREISEIVLMMKAIEEKTQFINDIVFQTKLLSFNASVEAARAGEHGKGFAVVAEEVGNLSRMSGTASSEITTLLNSSLKKVEEILFKTGERVQSMMKESGEVMTKATGTARSCQGALDKIVRTMKDIDHMVGDITVASKEQATGIKQINVAMSQVDTTTQVNAQTSTEVAEIAENMSGEIEKLKSSIKNLSTLSGIKEAA